MQVFGGLWLDSDLILKLMEIFEIFESLITGNFSSLVTVILSSRSFGDAVFLVTPKSFWKIFQITLKIILIFTILNSTHPKFKIFQILCFENISDFFQKLDF